MARNGLSEEQVKAIMATQATRAMRLAAADDVIDNNGDLASLEPQIAQLHDLYLAFSKRMAGMAPQRL
ncbi:Dephospho-CoA kinase [compost metagenome]